MKIYNYKFSKMSESLFLVTNFNSDPLDERTIDTLAKTAIINKLDIKVYDHIRGIIRTKIEEILSHAVTIVDYLSSDTVTLKFISLSLPVNSFSNCLANKQVKLKERKPSKNKQLKESFDLQKQSDRLIIPSVIFNSIVISVGRDFRTDLKYTNEALLFLQYHIEHYIITLIYNASVLMNSYQRDILTCYDINLVSITQNQNMNRSFIAYDLYSNDMKIYIKKVLSQLHSCCNISNDSVSQLNQFIHLVSKNVIDKAVFLSSLNGRTNITPRDIRHSLKLVFPGELYKHATSEGNKALTKYTNRNKFYTNDYHGFYGIRYNLDDDCKLYLSKIFCNLKEKDKSKICKKINSLEDPKDKDFTNTKIITIKIIQSCVLSTLSQESATMILEMANLELRNYHIQIELHKKKPIKVKGSRSSICGLQFSVRLIKSLDDRLFNTASIYLTASLEYIIAELLELAGNSARDRRSHKITSKDLFISSFNDTEISELLKRINFEFIGGVCYNILALMPNSQQSEISTLKEKEYPIESIDLDTLIPPGIIINESDYILSLETNFEEDDNDEPEALKILEDEEDIKNHFLEDEESEEEDESESEEEDESESEEDEDKILSTGNEENNKLFKIMELLRSVMKSKGIEV